jgi:hypothetical protein
MFPRFLVSWTGAVKCHPMDAPNVLNPLIILPLLRPLTPIDLQELYAS